MPREDMDQCGACGKLGYFKLGICAKCRSGICPDCAKPLRKSYLGQKRCAECERKWQAKARQSGAALD